MAMTVKEFAPAKINLCLHVTGQLPNGFHQLDSVVAFANVGDWVSAQAADHTSLTIIGDMAGSLPTDQRNLVMQAAALFPDHCTTEITLDKRLPQAAGIGGGSADAAATLRAMARLWDLPLPDLEAQTGLGADVPVCLESQPARMRGVGEDLTPILDFFPLPVVLVNPRVATATPPVFKALTSKRNPPLSDFGPAFSSPDSLTQWLTHQRNDLENPAQELHPEIGDVLAVIRDTFPILARMSGSGATCFGVYETNGQADAAADKIRTMHPNWWVHAGSITGA